MVRKKMPYARSEFADFCENSRHKEIKQLIDLVFGCDEYCFVAADIMEDIAWNGDRSGGWLYALEYVLASFPAHPLVKNRPLDAEYLRYFEAEDIEALKLWHAAGRQNPFHFKP